MKSRILIKTIVAVSVPVFYNGAVPDNFTDGKEVVVEGILMLQPEFFMPTHLLPDASLSIERK